MAVLPPFWQRFLLGCHTGAGKDEGEVNTKNPPSKIFKSHPIFLGEVNPKSLPRKSLHWLTATTKRGKSPSSLRNIMNYSGLLRPSRSFSRLNAPSCRILGAWGRARRLRVYRGQFLPPCPSNVDLSCIDIPIFDMVAVGIRASVNPVS